MPGFIRRVNRFVVLVFFHSLISVAVQALPAESLSLSLGGVRMDFVWVPVEGSDRFKQVQIGDFDGGRVKEKKRLESIYVPFERNGKRGYYLGKTEVTEEQWAAVIGEGPRSKLPVTGKTYSEVQVFLEKLNGLVREVGGVPSTPDGAEGVLKLPTEAEWEYAARGAEGPRYTEQDPYGGDLQRYEVFFLPGSEGRAKEVASRPPGPLGLHDMLGNVRELMQENYSVGGTSGGGFLLKGGSYLSERAGVRSSARTEHQRLGKDGKPSRRRDAGLRLCISAEIFTSLGPDAPGVAHHETDPVPEQADNPSMQFFATYQEFQRAERLAREGFVQDAAKKFRFVLTQFEQIRIRNPSWQPLVVEFRLTKTREALLRLEGASAPAMLGAPPDLVNLPAEESLAPGSRAVTATSSAGFEEEGLRLREKALWRAEPRLPRDGSRPMEIFEQQRVLVFPQGYTVHNDAGAVLKTVPGPVELPCRGIARDKAFAPKGAYLSEWSYQQTQKGETPNWVVGEPSRNDSLVLSTSASGAPDSAKTQFAPTRSADGFDMPVGKPNADGYSRSQRGNPWDMGDDWNGNGGGNSDLGAPVYSTAHGLVIYARDARMNAGKTVIVRHAYWENGKWNYVDSLYTHLHQMFVREGQQVKRGQLVGSIGTNRGMYTAHLHFEIRQNLRIGMNKDNYRMDLNNYFMPYEFILERRQLEGGNRRVRVPINTF